jgi:hypothetical protein
MAFMGEEAHVHQRGLADTAVAEDDDLFEDLFEDDPFARRRSHGGLARGLRLGQGGRVEHRWVNFLLLDDLLGSRGSGSLLSLLSLRSGLRAKREASGCHIASKAKHDEECRTLVAASLAAFC